jgi:hypothetical protein
MPEYSTIRHSKRRKNCKYHMHEDLSYPDNVTLNGCKCWIHLNLGNGAAVAYLKILPFHSVAETEEIQKNIWLGQQVAKSRFELRTVPYKYKYCISWLLLW